jgi:SAM-dependent methyltransferase
MTQFLDRLSAEVARRVGPLDRIRRSLDAMVRGFTRGRGSRPLDYLSTPDARRAYLALYAVPNAARMLWVIDRIGGGLSPGERALDVGAGTGSSALALAARSAKDSEIVLLDQSEPALEVAAELFSELFPDGPRVTCTRGDLDDESGKKNLPRGPFRIVTAGHVLNELLPRRGRDPGPARDLALTLARRAGTLVITEPAQRIPSRSLSKIRAALLEAGHGPIGPCPHHARCPVLAPKKQDWCVTDVPFERTGIVTEVDELLGLDRRKLTVSWLAATKKAKPRPAGTAEVLSEAMRTKDGPLYYLCTARGRIALAPGQMPNPPFLRGELIRLPKDPRPEGRDRSGAPRIKVNPKWIGRSESGEGSAAPA